MFSECQPNTGEMADHIKKTNEILAKMQKQLEELKRGSTIIRETRLSNTDSDYEGPKDLPTYEMPNSSNVWRTG